MNVALLTTETTHHVYYAQKLSAQFPLAAIFVEASAAAAPFDTAHPFEAARDDYERATLLGGARAQLHDVARTITVGSMNDPSAVEALRAAAPDVVLVFGTGRLAPAVIDVARVAALNLHGGNPEHYRGLDTHLWAVYHNDFDNLVTTLHVLDRELDTGDIVFQGAIPVVAGMELHQLRAANTKVCVQLSALALRALRDGGPLPARKQLARGRYYSFMPAVLKQVCVDRWRKHVGAL